MVARADTKRDSIGRSHLSLTVSDSEFKPVHVLLDFIIVIRVRVFSQTFLVLLEFHPELLETSLVYNDEIRNLEYLLWVEV
jgi:hypothetical protein